ncbi:YraN family protein [Gorillibacterium sp. sgz500922]|uniref:YraN family protein n=1 Tax=Gorillibacterium sp. sgz500922 TaxID=3446694 RepID=UPI003F662241
MTENKPEGSLPERAADGRRKTGQAGENAAVVYLTGCGFRIRERNWRCRSGELDLIAEDNGCLVFVEVRTRKPSPRFGTPQESVDARKQLQVRRTAEVYLHRTKQWERQVRFDLVSVRLDADGTVLTLDHLRHAF